MLMSVAHSCLYQDICVSVIWPCIHCVKVFFDCLPRGYQLLLFSRGSLFLMYAATATTTIPPVTVVCSRAAPIAITIYPDNGFHLCGLASIISSLCGSATTVDLRGAK